jgi:hypothetical protein
VVARDNICMHHLFLKSSKRLLAFDILDRLVPEVTLPAAWSWSSVAAR